MGYNFKKRLKYWCEYGNFSGIKYFIEENGYFGKIFWIIALIISAYGMAIIFKLTIASFRHDSITVNIDTSYLHWKNTFPAVSLCYAPGRSLTPIKEYLGNYMKEHNIPKPPSVMSYYKTIVKYMLINPIQQIEEPSRCKGFNSTCGVDIGIIQKIFLPASCSVFMFDLTYLGKKVNDCETIFKKTKTEMGECYIANSIVSYNLDAKKLPLTYDRRDHVPILKFRYNITSLISLQLFVHSPDGKPYFNVDKFILGTNYHTIHGFTTVETINFDDVKDVTIFERKCRFPDEKLPGSILPYSFSSCFTDLRIKLEMQECNCTIGTSPDKYREHYCDIKQLECIQLARINEKTKSLHFKRKTSCLPSCIEMDITKISEVEVSKKDDEIPSVSIKIANTPYKRYIRTVARTRLDAVVSIGGIFGLFFGASVLSIVEFFYIWLFRKFD